MGRLDDITLQDPQNQLESTDRKMPTKRVLAAMGRKQGNTLEILADRHNVCEKTIRNGVDRFAEQPIDQAPYDADRSGRLPELTDTEYDVFIADLHNSPAEFGDDRQAWFPALAHDHLKQTYGIEYLL